MLAWGLVVGLTACGDGDAVDSSGGSSVTTAPPSGASTTVGAGPRAIPPGYVEQIRRDATSEDFAPVCQVLDAPTLVGSYREFETDDAGVVTISGSGRADDVAALEEAWSRVGECDDGVAFRRWADAPAGASGWVVDLGGGTTQHAVLVVEGTDVLLIAASGEDSATAAADFVG